jgi:hypothetical protein
VERVLVLALAPDLILDDGSIRDTYAEPADRVQERTGIPYLLIDGRFENTPEALRLPGDVLGAPERAEMLAAETEALFARLDAVIAATPEEPPPAPTSPAARTGSRPALSARPTPRSSSARAASTWRGQARPGAVSSSSRWRTCSPGTPRRSSPGTPISSSGSERTRSGRASTPSSAAASSCRLSRPSAGSTARPRSTG